MHISDLFRARVFTRPDGYVLGVGSNVLTGFAFKGKEPHWKIFQNGFLMPEEWHYRFEVEHFDPDVTSHEDVRGRIALWEHGGFEEVRLSPGEDERWDFTILRRNHTGIIVGPVPGLQIETRKAADHPPISILQNLSDEQLKAIGFTPIPI